MKLKPIITHTFIFTAGSIFTAGYFLLIFVPSVANHIPADSLRIKLSENTAPEAYQPILERDFLGGLYLRNPLYFFKRQEGYDMLEGLAKEGYTGALTNIYAYETDKALKNLVKGDTNKASAHYKKAYDLAMLGVEQKSYFPLIDLIKTHKLRDRKDISEELKILEKQAKSSSRGGLALILSDYYELNADKQKAEYWQRIAKEINSENRPEPICMTITPWRGY